MIMNSSENHDDSIEHVQLPTCRMPSRYIRHSHNPPVDSLDAVKLEISSALPLTLERVYQNIRGRHTGRSISGNGVYVGTAGMYMIQL
jgi:hypothetical protein